jgi:cytochrome b6-f complex iron-sulfur subunit
VERRGFLKLLLRVLGSTALASFVYPVLKFLVPSRGIAQTSPLRLAKSSLPYYSATNVVYGNTPAVIINHPRKGLMAFSRVCTHLGCLVEYDREKNQLICPCHAGTYDLEGNVISGPPPKPLPKLPLRVNGNTVVIG